MVRHTFQWKSKGTGEKAPPISATAVEFIMYCLLTSAHHGSGWIQKFTDNVSREVSYDHIV